MAEGEGKTFENPTYDQRPWEERSSCVDFLFVIIIVRYWEIISKWFFTFCY